MQRALDWLLPALMALVILTLPVVHVVARIYAEPETATTSDCEDVKRHPGARK